MQFENPHDAAEAVQALNWKTLYGNCVKVKFAIRGRYGTHAQGLSPLQKKKHTWISSVSEPLPTEGTPINTPFTGMELNVTIKFWPECAKNGHRNKTWYFNN
ncbi:hypothetical protein XELAEV_18031533mg [Xenopus laevis]|uniref:RRM domain-containing protein n=1 Tax=Xenopus laevis TaxID=8355 RepID=A0A974CMR5_XENLA|nr:hypothetical protein XELAEV_18031533mg [Xenopus laevis]